MVQCCMKFHIPVPLSSHTCLSSRSFAIPYLLSIMSAIAFWHKGQPPRQGCLPLEFVRAVDENTLAENQLCEGFYNDNKEWYDCILLHIDKSKFAPSRYLSKKGKCASFSDKSANELANNLLTGAGKRELKRS